MFMYNVWIMNDVRLIKWLGINLLNTCKIMKECGEYLLTLLIERNLVDPYEFGKKKHSIYKHIKCWSIIWFNVQ